MVVTAAKNSLSVFSNNRLKELKVVSKAYSKTFDFNNNYASSYSKDSRTLLVKLLQSTVRKNYPFIMEEGSSVESSLSRYSFVLTTPLIGSGCDKTEKYKILIQRYFRKINGILSTLGFTSLNLSLSESEEYESSTDSYITYFVTSVHMGQLNINEYFGLYYLIWYFKETSEVFLNLQRIRIRHSRAVEEARVEQSLVEEAQVEYLRVEAVPTPPSDNIIPTNFISTTLIQVPW